MTRRSALQLLALVPAWQLTAGPDRMLKLDRSHELVVHLDWTSIEIRRGKETIAIDPQELFDALKGDPR